MSLDLHFSQARTFPAVGVLLGCMALVTACGGSSDDSDGDGGLSSSDEVATPVVAAVGPVIGEPAVPTPGTNETATLDPGSLAAIPTTPGTVSPVDGTPLEPTTTETTLSPIAGDPTRLDLLVGTLTLEYNFSLFPEDTFVINASFTRNELGDIAGEPALILEQGGDIFACLLLDSQSPYFCINTLGTGDTRLFLFNLDDISLQGVGSFTFCLNDVVPEDCVTELFNDPDGQVDASVSSPQASAGAAKLGIPSLSELGQDIALDQATTAERGAARSATPDGVGMAAATALVRAVGQAD